MGTRWQLEAVGGRKEGDGLGLIGGGAKMVVNESQKDLGGVFASLAVVSTRN